MRRFIYILSFLFLMNKSAAQDIHFSQYIYSPLNLSPALTGMFDGDVRANAYYRNQWNSITVPYKTYGLAYDQVLGQSSISGSRHQAGAVINSDRAGDGNLGTVDLLLSYSRLFSIDKDSVHFISAGIQGGLMYRSLDISQLSFDNQFTGDVYNPNASSNEQFDRDNHLYPDLHAGIAWLINLSNATIISGAGLKHILQPDQSLLNEVNGLPMHMQFHASWLHNKNNKLQLLTSANMMMQREFRSLMIGPELIYYLDKKIYRKRGIGLGVQYRMNDAIIPSASLIYDQWRFGLSYDVNTSDLNTVSRYRGGPEFNVTWIMKKIRYSKTKSICPVY